MDKSNSSVQVVVFEKINIHFGRFDTRLGNYFLGLQTFGRHYRY